MLKVPEYAATVHDIAAEQGREALSRGGTIATLKGDALEAAPSAHVTFPDKGARRVRVDDPAHAPFAMARQAGAINRVYAIDDTDLAGAVPYLPRGG